MRSRKQVQRSVVVVALALAGCSDGEAGGPMEGAGEQMLAPQFSGMPAAPSLARGLVPGYRDVVDLTQTLDENTPVIALPDPFANSPGYSREEISFFDFPRGPGWAWYSISLGEHTGTHFDVPCHWITGRDLACLHEVPPADLIAPAVVIDVRDEVAANPDYLVTVDDALEWEERYGRIPPRSYVLLHTGWSSRYDNAAAYLNGGHTPGPSPELSQFLAFERDILGIGVETVGTDAGQAGGFTPPFPNHNIMLGAGKYGITSLKNLDLLPPRGAILIVAPMKLRDGTGSPVRVLALVP